MLSKSDSKRKLIRLCYEFQLQVLTVALFWRAFVSTIYMACLRINGLIYGDTCRIKLETSKRLTQLIFAIFACTSKTANKLHLWKS